jgi:hypothetical protein
VSLSHSTALDRCQEKKATYYEWASLDSIGGDRLVPYTHDRPLPKSTAKKGMKYIAAILKAEGYPFQLSYAVMLPLWYRFTESWCNHGDELRALLDI